MNATPERFELDRTIRWLILLAPWMFAAFAALSAALPFLPDDGRPRNEAFQRAFSLVCTGAFATFAVFAFRAIRDLPRAAISIDDTGLWPTVLERNAHLVPWTSIRSLRERPMLQRLEALDASGQVVAKLEYQLVGFARLRAIVLERARLDRVAPADRSEFRKSVWHHAFNLGSMLAFTALAGYLSGEQPMLALACFVVTVGGIGWDYLRTPHHLSLSSSTIEIRLPMRRIRLARAQVRRIEMADLSANHAMHPVVLLHADGMRPIRLVGLARQTVDLFRALQRWHVEEAR